MSSSPNNSQNEETPDHEERAQAPAPPIAAASRSLPTPQNLNDELLQVLLQTAPIINPSPLLPATLAGNVGLSQVESVPQLCSKCTNPSKRKNGPTFACAYDGCDKFIHSMCYQKVLGPADHPRSKAPLPKGAHVCSRTCYNAVHHQTKKKSASSSESSNTDWTAKRHGTSPDLLIVDHPSEMDEYIAKTAGYPRQNTGH